MVEVDQQVEDDNNQQSDGPTTPIVAAKESELKLDMIRLYGMMFGNDDTSSTAVIIRMASDSTTNEETERMIRNIYRETVCPMFYADFNQMHQNFVFMIRQKFGLDLSTGMTWNLCNTETTSTSQSLQLKFLNGIATPVSTGKIIEGKEQKPFLVALVDETSGHIVTTGPEADTKVEIVVLEGDANDDEADNWTSDEFNDTIISEWKQKSVIKGNRVVKLNKGIVSIDNISFTHNSGWKGNRKCRMGARVVNAVFPTRVKEAKTESFFVRDKRKDLYIKHEIPSLTDHLYRLHDISHRGDCFKRLSQEHIKTVMDLLTFHAINPQRLKNILKVSPNKCKIIMDHANMCKDDKSKWVYLYHHPTDGQTVNGVAFNIFGKLVGNILESRFVTCDNLPGDKRADAQKLIVSSTENWKEVVTFNNQDLLIEHLHSPTTLNTFSNNNLSVVIPKTIDPHNHTNLTSPKSQSPKCPASEHTISNSPKQPRYDHPKLTSSTHSVGIGDLPQGDDETEYLKYLNFPADTWKIVCYAVGWICILSKPRKRRTTFCHEDTVIVIAASLEHAQACD